MAIKRYILSVYRQWIGLEPKVTRADCLLLTVVVQSMSLAVDQVVFKTLTQRTPAS